jgi:hypothetical protein
MKSHPVRFALLATSALLLCSSCSKQGGGNGEQSADRNAGSSPGISPSAAPGVAFNYSYEFGLPDRRIAATQEVHAAACEKLGLARCRITGMSYNVGENEQVAAELELKLDPAIARQFGKSAQAAVEGNDGKLIRLAIGSSDEGAVIEQAARQKGNAASQEAQLRQELAQAKPGSDEHANLLAQIQGLQQQAADQSATIATSEATLASTPMAFHYYGRGGVPGFRGNPILSAWQTFVTTVVWLVGILLQGVAVLVPVFTLIVVFLLLWRTRPIRALREWIRGPVESEA